MSENLPLLLCRRKKKKKSQRVPSPLSGQQNSCVRCRLARPHVRSPARLPSLLPAERGPVGPGLARRGVSVCLVSRGVPRFYQRRCSLTRTHTHPRFITHLSRCLLLLPTLCPPHPGPYAERVLPPGGGGAPWGGGGAFCRLVEPLQVVQFHPESKEEVECFGEPPIIREKTYNAWDICR